MIVTLGQTVTPAIAHENVSGAPSNASSIAFTLWRNGVATAEAITPTNPETGVYRISFTVPSGWSVGDFLQVRAVADGIARFVWAATIDARVASRAIPGDEMGLTSTVLAALFSDTDTTALVNAIIARVESDLDGADLSTAAIAVAVRNELLNRVLSGNHETAGSVGKVLQFLDAAISGRMAAGNVTVGGYAAGQDPATLLNSTVSKVSSVDTLLAALTEVVESVTRFRDSALSQAPTGGGGGSGDASQETLIEVQEAVDSIAVGLAGGSPVEPTGVSIREQLNLIQSNTSPLSNLTASLPIKAGVIVGPSEPLVIGDDYTSTVGRQVRVNLLNSTGGSAVTTFGSKSLSDAGVSIQLLLRKSGQPSAAAQLVGTCSFFPAETVDGAEIPPYLLVSFSRTETAKATPGAYDMQAEAVWLTGEVVTFAPYGQVEFVRNIQRVS